MSSEQKEKRKNQPHAKPIVKICPKTFKILKEYSSQGAVVKDGFRREDIRKALKKGGISKGFLWAFKGMETPTIQVVKKRGNIDIKLQANLFKKPTKEELEKHYIKRNLTCKECAKIFRCHHNTIARIASEYGLKKRNK